MKLGYKRTKKPSTCAMCKSEIKIGKGVVRYNLPFCNAFEAFIYKFLRGGKI